MLIQPDAAEQFDRAVAALPALFGIEGLRPGQADVLRAVYAGEDVLTVMPTGSGKSLCFQLPALTRSGLTLVVSPLIALMRDQMLALAARGAPAAALHSLNTTAENAAIFEKLRSRKLKLLYLSPERLARPDVQEALRAAGTRLVAVDEAHCIAHWGHHFRPDYLDLKDAIAALGDPQVIALTASADGPTRDEIVARLFARTPSLHVRSFDRPNLRLSFRRKTNAMRQVADFVAQHRGRAGLVYAGTRRRTEIIASILRLRGHDAEAYHAGLSSAARQAAQDAFLTRPSIVIVGTIAFGLGVDRPDIRFVCHADMPSSIETYYQEIGRAGRDGLPADTLTLYSEDDATLRRDRIAHHDRSVDHQALESQKFEAFLALCESRTCRRAGVLAALGEDAAPCGVCDNCRARWRFLYDPRAWTRSVQRAATTLLARWDTLAATTPAEEDVSATRLAPAPDEPPLSVAQARLAAALQAERTRLARLRRVAPRAICAGSTLQRAVLSAPRDLAGWRAIEATIEADVADSLSRVLRAFV